MHPKTGQAKDAGEVGEMKYTNRIIKRITLVVALAITCVIFTNRIYAQETATLQQESDDPLATASREQELPGVKTVDIVLFVGQSNMAGCGGNAALAPAVPNDVGYEFRPLTDPSGLHPIVEPFGRGDGGYISDPAPVKNGSMVSSFVNTYYGATGVPVVAVSASRGATDSAYWASTNVKSELLNRYTLTKSFLQANHITVRRAFAIFLQGESDALEKTTTLQYQTNITAAFEPLFISGLERVYVITPGHAKGNILVYDPIVQAQIDLCGRDSRFTLASTSLRSMSDAYMSDEVHYGQQALNMIGAEVANVAASN